jgi:hypothetical protein
VAKIFQSYRTDSVRELSRAGLTVAQIYRSGGPHQHEVLRQDLTPEEARREQKEISRLSQGLSR